MLARPIVRAASTTAAAAATSTAAPSSSAASSSSAAALSAYLLLSRPPTILRSPTPFESAYHAYNSKLQRVLSQPFARDVYFKKGSAAENKFLKEEKERKAATFAEQEDQGARQSASSSTVEASEVEGQDLYRTVSRTTKADEENRTDSLDRSLDRSLFLLVKGGEMGSQWTLPFTKVDKDGFASLHKAAPDAVYSLLGKEMDIWMVSNLPVGMLASGKGGDDKGFVMRAHILAGQPSSSTATKDIEFAWLTKEEVQQRVPKEYWESLADLLSA